MKCLFKLRKKVTKVKYNQNFDLDNFALTCSNKNSKSKYHPEKEERPKEKKREKKQDYTEQRQKKRGEWMYD